MDGLVHLAQHQVGPVVHLGIVDPVALLGHGLELVDDLVAV